MQKQDLSIVFEGTGSWSHLLVLDRLLDIKIAVWQKLAYLRPLTPHDPPQLGVLGAATDGTQFFSHVDWPALYWAVQDIAAHVGPPPRPGA